MASSAIRHIEWPDLLEYGNIRLTPLTKISGVHAVAWCVAHSPFAIRRSRRQYSTKAPGGQPNPLIDNRVKKMYT
jgi:hypothetical protein